MLTFLRGQQLCEEVFKVVIRVDWPLSPQKSPIQVKRHAQRHRIHPIRRVGHEISAADRFVSSPSNSISPVQSARHSVARGKTTNKIIFSLSPLALNSFQIGANVQVTAAFREYHRQPKERTMNIKNSTASTEFVTSVGFSLSCRLPLDPIYRMASRGELRGWPSDFTEFLITGGTDRIRMA